MNDNHSSFSPSTVPPIAIPCLSDKLKSLSPEEEQKWARVERAGDLYVGLRTLESCSALSILNLDTGDFKSEIIV